MSDTIFISYPKSGRTWLRFMLDQLDIKLKYDHMGTGSARHDWGRRVNVLKFDADLDSFSKIIFMARDPRDVVVSFFHQMTRREILTPREKWKFLVSGRMPPKKLDRFVRHPGFGIERVIRFNLGWAERLARDPRAMIVLYEDMRLDPKNHFRAMLDFIGASVSHSALASAISAGDFNRMKEGERQGIFAKKYGPVLSPTDPADSNTYKVRRGKVGGYSSEMEAGTIDFCGNVLDATLYFDKMEAAIQTFSSRELNHASSSTISSLSVVKT